MVSKRMDIYILATICTYVCANVLYVGGTREGSKGEGQLVFGH